MIKIYLDASVIIPAILSPTGGSAKLIQFVKLGLVAGITSQNVVEEVERNSDKINKSAREIRRFIQENSVLIRERINPSDIVGYEDMVDIKDAHVLAGAKLTDCDYLTTLDKKHLLKGEVKKQLYPLKVVTPKELLEELVR